MPRCLRRPVYRPDGARLVEKLFIKSAKDATLTAAQNARRVSMMIALGIGLHNFSEGLAIGQAYSWAIPGWHGFWSLVLPCIMRPKVSHCRTSVRAPAIVGFLGLMGLIGGGPTLLGSLIGSFWTLKPLEIFFLSMASGSILYVVGNCCTSGVS